MVFNKKGAVGCALIVAILAGYFLALRHLLFWPSWQAQQQVRPIDKKNVELWYLVSEKVSDQAALRSFIGNLEANGFTVHVKGDATETYLYLGSYLSYRQAEYAMGFIDIGLKFKIWLSHEYF